MAGGRGVPPRQAHGARPSGAPPHTPALFVSLFRDVLSGLCCHEGRLVQRETQRGPTEDRDACRIAGGEPRELRVHRHPRLSLVRHARGKDEDSVVALALD